MSRKALALDAYAAGSTAVEAARIAGLSPNCVRTYICMAGISRPVGRPRKHREEQGA